MTKDERYRLTEKYRAKQRRYYDTEKCREATRKRQAKYRATEAGAIMRHLWNTSPRGRLFYRLFKQASR